MVVNKGLTNISWIKYIQYSFFCHHPSNVVVLYLAAISHVVRIQLISATNHVSIRVRYDILQFQTIDKKTTLPVLCDTIDYDALTIILFQMGLRHGDYQSLHIAGSSREFSCRNVFIVVFLRNYYMTQTIIECMFLLKLFQFDSQDSLSSISDEETESGF